jgi:hypothetical protein
MTTTITIEAKLTEIFYKDLTLSNYSRAIYKGGSRVDPIIENPHDYDYICFAKPFMKCILLAELRKKGFCRGQSANVTKFATNKIKNKIINTINTKTTLNEIDLSQIRTVPYTQIT